MTFQDLKKIKEIEENIIKDARNLSRLTQEIDDTTVKYFKTGKKN